jgi:hypothetical protein
MDNIKMDLVEIEWSCVEWIEMVQDRYKWIPFVKAVMDHWVP